MSAKEALQEIDEDIVSSIENNNYSANTICKKHNITPKTLYSHIGKLIRGDILTRVSKGKYQIKKHSISIILNIDSTSTPISEDIVFKERVQQHVADLPEAAYKSLTYVFLEMLNNAIEHSRADSITIGIVKSFIEVEFWIMDNGIGIFENIKTKFQLKEKRYAILELAKGKLTTDPQKHTGEGIFFSSKIADVFFIRSDDLSYYADHSIADEGILFKRTELNKGTIVYFSIKKCTEKTPKIIFEEFSSGGLDMNFNKTIIPVSLLEQGEERPIFLSRSQARRLTSRFDRFENIVLDFEGVDEIGQAFADELFRVFKNDHPNIMISIINCSEDVKRMIDRVANTK